MHTPGHTPEGLSFLITDGATTSEPGFIITGDFVFVGDVGRPDLIDESAGGIDTRFEGTKQLFASLRDPFLTLPDFVQVHPGHGAGSACGKSLGAIASSTVGYERCFAWWSKHLQNNDLEGFTIVLLEGQPEAPAYFGRMKCINKSGPNILGNRGEVVKLEANALKPILEAGTMLIDTRSREAFQTGALSGSLHLPAGKNFSTWAAWLIDPEHDGCKLVLLARDATHATQLRDELSRVGIDRVIGFIDSLEGLALRSQMPVSLEEIAKIVQPFALDVCAKSEYEAGHIPGATQLHAGHLYNNLERIPNDRPVVLHCQSGAGSTAATSYLRSQGFSNILEMRGGYVAWAERKRETITV